MTDQHILRSPSTTSALSQNAIVPPPLEWLSGSWTITHTTLPALRKARKVTITYTPIPDTGELTEENFRYVQYGTHLAESVTFVFEASISTVSRVSKPASTPGGAKGEQAPDWNGDSYSWGERSALVYRSRRQHWRELSRNWEILGYNDDPRFSFGPDPKSISWLVVYSEKTFFDPAGLSIYCRHGKVRQETLDSIIKGLSDMGGNMAKLVNQLHEFTYDGENPKNWLDDRVLE